MKPDFWTGDHLVVLLLVMWIFGSTYAAHLYGKIEDRIRGVQRELDKIKKALNVKDER